MKKENNFEIPIVLLIFKRKEKLVKIIEQIKKINPKKIYIIADGPRSYEEKKEVDKCREVVEKQIDWKCEIIKKYSKKNCGVYENIALGAKFVFEREEYAIFLEDDNLPEITFFSYCRELLYKYKDDNRILWICGTNYLENYIPKDGSSYVFTRHLMPCGWASWSNKFLCFYDFKLSLLEDKTKIKEIKNTYINKKLFKQQSVFILNEKQRMKNGIKPLSWDFIMEYSVRANKLMGISPSKNQIINIGVDEFSIHGGKSLLNIMTKRFCGIKSYPLNFPLIHPKRIYIDNEYEKKVSKIILRPWYLRLLYKFIDVLKKIFKIPNYISFSEIKEFIKDKYKK